MTWQHHGPDLARPENTNTVTLASDDDRDATVGVLNEAFAEGRLTMDEHAERVRAAYAARTWQELAGITDDLPGQAGSPAPVGTAGHAVAGVPLDRCLLCALLILCPPAGIAWLLATLRRSRDGRRLAVTDRGGRPVSAAAGTARAGDGWHAEDR